MDSLRTGFVSRADRQVGPYPSFRPLILNQPDTVVSAFSLAGVPFKDASKRPVHRMISVPAPRTYPIGLYDPHATNRIVNSTSNHQLKRPLVHAIPQQFAKRTAVHRAPNTSDIRRGKIHDNASNSIPVVGLIPVQNSAALIQKRPESNSTAGSLQTDSAPMEKLNQAVEYFAGDNNKVALHRNNTHHEHLFDDSVGVQISSVSRLSDLPSKRIMIEQQANEQSDPRSSEGRRRDTSHMQQGSREKEKPQVSHDSRLPIRLGHGIHQAIQKPLQQVQELKAPTQHATSDQPLLSQGSSHVAKANTNSIKDLMSRVFVSPDKPKAMSKLIGRLTQVSSASRARAAETLTDEELQHGIRMSLVNSNEISQDGAGKVKGRAGLSFKHPSWLAGVDSDSSDDEVEEETEDEAKDGHNIENSIKFQCEDISGIKVISNGTYRPKLPGHVSRPVENSKSPKAQIRHKTVLTRKLDREREVTRISKRCTEHSTEINRKAERNTAIEQVVGTLISDIDLQSSFYSRLAHQPVPQPLSYDKVSREQQRKSKGGKRRMWNNISRTLLEFGNTVSPILNVRSNGNSLRHLSIEHRR